MVLLHSDMMWSSKQMPTVSEAAGHSAHETKRITARQFSFSVPDVLEEWAEVVS